jgi:hypothetical protein
MKMYLNLLKINTEKNDDTCKLNFLWKSAKLSAEISEKYF